MRGLGSELCYTLHATLPLHWTACCISNLHPNPTFASSDPPPQSSRPLSLPISVRLVLYGEFAWVVLAGVRLVECMIVMFNVYDDLTNGSVCWVGIAIPSIRGFIPIGAGRMRRGGTILKLQFLYFIVGPLIHLVEICECSD